MLNIEEYLKLGDEDLYFVQSNFVSQALTEHDNVIRTKKDKIRALRVEMEAKRAEYLAEIAKINAEISKYPTEGEIRKDARDMKAQLREALHQRIIRYIQEGITFNEIAKKFNLASTQLIYKVRNEYGLEKRQEVKPLPPKHALNEAEWLSFDNKAIHLYAVSKCGNYIKVLSRDGERHQIIYAEPPYKYLQGDKKIKPILKRIETLKSMAKGEDIGNYIKAKNPNTF